MVSLSGLHRTKAPRQENCSKVNGGLFLSDRRVVVAKGDEEWPVLSFPRYVSLKSIAMGAQTKYSSI